ARTTSVSGRSGPGWGGTGVVAPASIPRSDTGTAGGRRDVGLSGVRTLRAACTVTPRPTTPTFALVCSPDLPSAPASSATAPPSRQATATTTNAIVRVRLRVAVIAVVAAQQKRGGKCRSQKQPDERDRGSADPGHGPDHAEQKRGGESGEARCGTHHRE